MRELKDHIISDERIITLSAPNYKEGNMSLKFKVKSDFVITDEWIKEKLKDPQLSECIEFLERKRFKQDPDGRWSKRSKQQENPPSWAGVGTYLPYFFFDKENHRLKVKFGEIDNVREFAIPRVYNGYASIDEFPTKLRKPNGKNGYLSINVPHDERDDQKAEQLVIITAYNAYHDSEALGNPREKNINCQYYSLILKFHEHITMKSSVGSINDKHDYSYVLERHLETFKKDKDFLKMFNEMEERIVNTEKSEKSIEKFSL